MKQKILVLVLPAILLSCSPKKPDLARYVDPFIGTGGHGHTYPGAAMPFGMVQLSPDTRLEGWDGCSGYHYSDSIVFGFSHTHLSGTGVPDYCDILFMPLTGKIELNNGSHDPDEGYASRFSHENESAHPGSYTTFLDDENILVELTATRRAGFHRYTFPGSDASHVVVDLQHRDKVIGSSLSVVSNTELEGFRRSSSWATDQRLFFVARFSKPFSERLLTNRDSIVDADHVEGTHIKACLSFETSEDETVLIKVGLSAVSMEGARNNLDTEIPGWDFDEIRAQAREAWNQELQKILVEGGTKQQKTIFYTALYHAFLAPNLFMDADDRYLGRDFQVHKADGYEHHTVFSLWDTFRAAHPLFTLIQQKRTVDFIRTMLSQYEQGGRLPVWELAANETECMIGYHSVPVIVDAYQKGVRDFDAELAFQAMKHSANLDHFGLKSYRENGYIPAEDDAESVSKTLEYAYDDWCIAQMAQKMGKTEDYRVFIQRAQSWKNLFDPSTGFMRAKMNGRWFEPFDPHEVNFNYTEANAWQYSFFVPQDISGMMEWMGGSDRFVEKLDQLFETSSETTGREQSDITGMIGQYAHGNEPSHHMAYLYSYAGMRWKTQEMARRIMDELYTTGPEGLCGNEDCGQMSAWYVLSAMGFYPVTPGSDAYVLGSPLFRKVTIHLENGKTFVIKAPGINGKNRYIQSVTLNGEPYSKSFIRHGDIINGGEMIMEMASRPSENQDIHSGSIPLSFITEHPIVPVPYIVRGERTFLEGTEIELGRVDESSRIFYTLDGSEPDGSAIEYKGPFGINHSGMLRAIAIRDQAERSAILESDFIQLPAGRSIRLNTSYASQYAAGGEKALIDGIKGPLNFRTGAWQGYEGVDLDAVIDLGKLSEVKKIAITFLQDNNAWIFLPVEVTFYLSPDGNDFTTVDSVRNTISPHTEGVFVEDFSAEPHQRARFVRIRATNMGLCPEWHKGSGGKSWIFADEIICDISD